MSNLEKLHLNIDVSMKKTFVDGNNLNTNIINYMSRLNKFTFNIRSYLDDINLFDLPTNEDIKQTFNDFKTNHIISCVDYFPSQHSGWCSIFTYPFPFKSYIYVTNNFPSVLCRSVREIVLHDERPFEYEFFLRTSHSFPFVEKLFLSNCNRPKKHYLDNQDLSMIKFHHLTYLSLYGAHDDYIELFLDGTKTSLLKNIHLNVCSKALERVTCRFTSHTTRINYEKIKSLCLYGCVLSTYARNYFPHAEIC